MVGVSSFILLKTFVIFVDFSTKLDPTSSTPCFLHMITHSHCDVINCDGTNSRQMKSVLSSNKLKRQERFLVCADNVVWVTQYYLNCWLLPQGPLRLCVSSCSMVLKTNIVLLVKYNVCFQSHTLGKSTVLDFYHYRRYDKTLLSISSSVGLDLMASMLIKNQNTLSYSSINGKESVLIFNQH